jgi:hypothetical protein
MGNLFIDMIDVKGSSVHNIPAGWKGKIAGYNAGLGDVPWTPAQWAQFPTTGKVRMNEYNPDPFASDVYVTEDRAFSITEVVGIAVMRSERKWNTDIYIDRANINLLILALHKAGVPPGVAGNPGGRIFLADWNLNHDEAVALLNTNFGGYPVMAVQWASPSTNPHTVIPGTSVTLAQANADLSVTVPAWFAAPPAVPVPLKVIFTSYDGGKTWSKS